MNPTIKFEVDPHNIVQLAKGQSIEFGGVRVRSTLYVVQHFDLADVASDSVVVVAVPMHEKFELRIIE